MKFKLLTTNLKLQKESGHTIYGLNLAPHRVSGYNVCPSAGLCSEICIGTHVGFMRMPNVRKSQIRKTRYFFQDKANFLSDLHIDLNKLAKQPNPACRLNVDSDLPWESIDKTLFDYEIIYYDYTKEVKRFNKKLPDNYFLTYSYSEKSDKSFVNKLLKIGKNVAIVFPIHWPSEKDVSLPQVVKINTKTWPVVDGDQHDLRVPAKDGTGVVVGLRAKMSKLKIEHYKQQGFIYV